jgi:NDP-sugar pyrophosphorylase family protein
VDLKEQALPAIAARFSVKVVHFSNPTALPVRTRADYIEALVRHHGAPPDGGEGRDWQPAFGLVEDPRDVGPGARIHESVVLRGGRVEAGAVLVRSVVCPGAVVRRGAMMVDELVAARDGNRRAM